MALLAGLGSVLTAHGLAWSRSGARPSPTVVAVCVAPFAFFGSLGLIWTQWPLAVALGIPVLGWLVTTTLGTAFAWQDA
ncbi:hypothetical protein [Kitasatospora arboriphila]|uniref:Uncharacterized protein n=1 Tax=Kitasatospora arboriphila TaxID=258052 RepID=A0ABN1U1M1_9ACTN